MIVITSNVERQLPAPFLRRCVFYHIEFPDHKRLRDIVKLRFPEHQPLFLDKVVSIFEHARDIPELIKQPSTAELLNWTGALALFERAHVQATIADFEEQLNDRGQARGKLRWSDLPAVGCLFKLKDDLDKEARYAGSA
jgi:MoxR-like ATPase